MNPTTQPSPRTTLDADLIQQLLADNPDLGNLELAEIYLIRVRQEDRAQAGDLPGVARAFAEAKATNSCQKAAASPASLGVDELLLVRQWADAAGGVGPLRARVLEIEAMAERVGGMARLKASLTAL